MSMNLHCDRMDVIQTSTCITALILSYDANGMSDGGWKEVAKRYKLWLFHLKQTEFNEAVGDEEKQKGITEFYDSNLEKLNIAVTHAEVHGYELLFYSE